MKQLQTAFQHGQRRAITMYEVVFVMTVAALIATATIPTLARLIRTDRAAQVETMTYRALERLAHQFRVDVRQSNSVKGGDGLILSQEGGQILYLVENQTLRRKSTRQNKTMVDAFALPRDTRFEFEPPDANSRLTRIQVQLPRRPREELDAIFLPVEIAALPGGDLANPSQEDSP